jgi:hypothetical protein
LLQFQWGKDSLKDKVRFELKGDFEEEAPWGSSHNCLPFRMRTVWGTALKSISDIDVGCYVAS